MHDNCQQPTSSRPIPIVIQHPPQPHTPHGMGRLTFARSPEGHGPVPPPSPFCFSGLDGQVYKTGWQRLVGDQWLAGDGPPVVHKSRPASIPVGQAARPTRAGSLSQSSRSRWKATDSIFRVRATTAVLFPRRLATRVNHLRSGLASMRPSVATRCAIWTQTARISGRPSRVAVVIEHVQVQGSGV